MNLERNLFWPGNDFHPSATCHGCHRKWAPFNSQPSDPSIYSYSADFSLAVLSQTCWTLWTLKGIFFGPEMTSIHPPRATAAIENELLSIASQVQVWGANWNVNDRSIFVLTLTLQSTRTLSSLQGLLPGFLAVWLPPAIWLAGLYSDSMPYAGMVSLPTLISNAEYWVKNQQLPLKNQKKSPR